MASFETLQVTGLKDDDDDGCPRQQISWPKGHEVRPPATRCADASCETVQVIGLKDDDDEMVDEAGRDDQVCRPSKNTNMLRVSGRGVGGQGAGCL